MNPGQMPNSGMQDMYNQNPPGAMSNMGISQRQQFPYGSGYDRRWVTHLVLVDNKIPPFSLVLKFCVVENWQHHLQLPRKSVPMKTFSNNWISFLLVAFHILLCVTHMVTPKWLFLKASGKDWVLKKKVASLQLGIFAGLIFHTMTGRNVEVKGGETFHASFFPLQTSSFQWFSTGLCERKQNYLQAAKCQGKSEYIPGAEASAWPQSHALN